MEDLRKKREDIIRKHSIKDILSFIIKYKYKITLIILILILIMYPSYVGSMIGQWITSFFGSLLYNINI
jgi:hypothetical protein